MSTSAASHKQCTTQLFVAPFTLKSKVCCLSLVHCPMHVAHIHLALFHPGKWAFSPLGQISDSGMLTKTWKVCRKATGESCSLQWFLMNSWPRLSPAHSASATVATTPGILTSPHPCDCLMSYEVWVTVVLFITKLSICCSSWLIGLTITQQILVSYNTLVKLSTHHY